MFQTRSSKAGFEEFGFNFKSVAAHDYLSVMSNDIIEYCGPLSETQWRSPASALRSKDEA